MIDVEAKFKTSVGRALQAGPLSESDTLIGLHRSRKLLPVTADRLKRIGLVLLGLWVVLGIVAFVLWSWPGVSGQATQ